MNCELIQSRMTALLDGELSPDAAADTERHLADCFACTQRRAELIAVKESASAWNMDAPDISARVMAAIAADDQHLLLNEIRLLRAEMAELRAEVAALRRQTARRVETPWPPSSRFEEPKDYPRLENDPWNLIRS